MARTSYASVNIDVRENPDETARAQEDMPFRILVAGDFSGGAGRIRKPIPVDRDNFEEVLALLSPELRLRMGDAQFPIRFQELDDFHPDRLFQRVEPFQALRSLRDRVQSGPLATAASTTAPASGADLLRAMIGEEAPKNPPVGSTSAWDRMLQEIVAPYAEGKPDPRRPALVAQTDRAITGEMRALLHHREFQSIEAAWRGLFFLVRRLETGEHLRIYLWDMPQAELTGLDGMAALRRVVADEAKGTPAAEPWAMIAGLYYFGPSEENALLQLAATARTAGTPLIAGVAPDVVGLARVFPMLRRSPDAQWIGLAMPRFLLRLPYGTKTSPVDNFAFEEMPEPPEHERYLWGNPAIACAYLLAEAFSRRGWQMRPGEVNQIDGLPAHTYARDGEPQLKPCAEVLLTDESIDLLLSRGLMPLVSIKGTDRVRLARFQSMADPATALAGRWA